VEIFFGDVRDLQSVGAACHDIDLVVHAAAALHGSAKVIVDSAVEGTRNVALATKQNSVKRVVYLSSMSVYNLFDLRDGEAISEKTPLEELPQERGAYSLAKRRAEDEAVRCLADTSPSWTIVRPSVVVGKKYDLFSPVGKRMGNILIGFDSPKKLLRLIHVDDVARAISEIIRNDDTKGRIYNLSNRAMAQRDYVNGLRRRRGLANLRVVYVPYWLMRGIAGFCNSMNAVVSRVPRISPRQLASLYRDVQIHCEPIGGQGGWYPEENLLERLRTESE
jgi:nucleoside-diphosphate-sugar epimerase